MESDIFSTGSRVRGCYRLRGAGACFSSTIRCMLMRAALERLAIGGHHGASPMESGPLPDNER